MCVCSARAAWGVSGWEDWVWTNPVGKGGVLDVCLCFGCGSVRGVGGEWVGGLDQGLEGIFVYK